MVALCSPSNWPVAQPLFQLFPPVPPLPPILFSIALVALVVDAYRVTRVTSSALTITSLPITGLIH